MKTFRWNESNIDHIAEHGVAVWEAEDVVNRARSPWPGKAADEKYVVWGQTRVGRQLQVIYVLDPNESIYVIHARPLSDSEKRSYRKRRR